jgi:mannosyltransferase OCH1-like enzyme
VERADFFRYMVVLKHGGAYADIDTECRVPLDTYLRATDTMVVGWENEFATDEAAFARHFVRRRQVRNEGQHYKELDATL